MSNVHLFFKIDVWTGWSYLLGTRWWTCNGHCGSDYFGLLHRGYKTKFIVQLGTWSPHTTFSPWYRGDRLPNGQGSLTIAVDRWTYNGHIYLSRQNPSLQNNATRCKIQMESSFISPNENPDSTSKTVSRNILQFFCEKCSNSSFQNVPLGMYQIGKGRHFNQWKP